MIFIYRCVVLLLFFLLVGCVGEDRVINEAISIERGEAEFVDMDLLMSAGDLTVSGAPISLFSGEFTYQQSDYNPVHEYETEDNRGHLIIEQPSVVEPGEEEANYISDVQLSTEVPIVLRLTKREGQADIDLTTVELNRLTAELGESTTLLDVTGDQITLAGVELSGSGLQTVNFDGSYPSLLTFDTTFTDLADVVTLRGIYEAMEVMNIITGEAADEVTLVGRWPGLFEMNVDTGGGDDRVVLSGDFGEENELTVNVGTGVDVVDLTGDWTRDTTITILSEDQETTLNLPQNVGVSVEIIGRSLEVNAVGMEFDGDDIYTNAAFGQADVTLSIRLNKTVGDLINLFNLEVE